MKKLVGAELSQLETNLTVSGPVALISCELVVEGNAPHQGGGRNAILSVSLYSGRMTAGILDRGRISVFAMPYARGAPLIYDHLPAHVRDWVHVAASGFQSRGKPPADFRLLPPAGN